VMIEGEPPQHVLFRADETRIVDTWTTSGLRGTGSHDIEAKDVLVPSERVFSLFGMKSVFGILAAGVAAVATGIAQHAIDVLVELATKKQPLGSKRSVAHRELVQLAVATAEAKVRAARLLLHDAVGALDDSLRARAAVRLAAAHAVTECAAAVDLMYEAGGGTSIYATSPLQRCFRDVHTITQHVMVSKSAAILAGRVLLDIESDTSML